MHLAFEGELFSNSFYNFHSFFNSSVLFMLYGHILHTDMCMASLRVMHICAYFSQGKMWPLINMQCGTVVIEVGRFKMHSLIIAKKQISSNMPKAGICQAKSYVNWNVKGQPKYFSNYAEVCLLIFYNSEPATLDFYHTFIIIHIWVVNKHEQY